VTDARKQKLRSLDNAERHAEARDSGRMKSYLDARNHQRDRVRDSGWHSTCVLILMGLIELSTGRISISTGRVIITREALAKETGATVHQVKRWLPFVIEQSKVFTVRRGREKFATHFWLNGPSGEPAHWCWSTEHAEAARKSEEWHQDREGRVPRSGVGAVGK
jgi:hypothetical protein